MSVLTLRRASAAALLAMAVVLLALAASAPQVAAATERCDRVAAPDGSDRARGTRSRPFRTFKRLARSLRPGRVGCLRRGVYRERNVRIGKGGREGRPLTLRSYPGERATIRGRIWIARSASHVKIAHLVLDGSRAPACPPGGSCAILPSPVVNGDFARFIGNRVTNRNRSTCFNLGSLEYGRAVGTVIQGNRIHRCGRLPATNLDHGIYIQRADRTRVVDNLIHHNADRGIQLYPDAQHTWMGGNLIDSNGTGVQFSGAFGLASSNNLLTGSVVTRSARHDVASWYPPGNPHGVANAVGASCLAGGRHGEVGGGAVEIRSSVRIGGPCPALTLTAGKDRVRNSGRVGLTGWWRAGRRARPRVALETDRGGRWTPVGRARLRSGGRYSARLRVRRLQRPRPGGSAVVRLRARLPGVGASRPTTITVIR